MGIVNKGFLLYLGGLRGVAILLVILFHMLPQYFSQGYLGVDVFLVISGFLLVRAYDTRQAFSFWDFVHKKILRLYPVLACAVILACLLMAFAMYSADEAKVLDRTVRYALQGRANSFFNKEYTDYFSASANLNPLLHLWYLAVIMQVYLFWAVGCWVVSFLSQRFAGRAEGIRRGAVWVLVLVSLASFAYSHSLALHDMLSALGVPVWQQAQEVPYWNTFGRIWQVAAGGLVFVLPSCYRVWQRAILGGVGLVLLLAQGFCNVSLTPCAALLTVVGTVLVLRYLPETRLRVLLEKRWLTWLGGISFSLYLVHFPLLVFYKRWEKLFPDLTVAAELIAISLIAAYVLWRFVERRRVNMLGTLILVAVAFGVCSGTRKYIKKVAEPGILASGNHVAIAYPVYTRPLEKVPDVLFEGFDREILQGSGGTLGLMYDADIPPFPELYVIGPVSIRPEFVLIGDSNAQHWYSGMNELCHNVEVSGLHLSSTVVPFMNRYVEVGAINYKWDSQKFEALSKWMKHHESIHTVVISQLWRNHLFAGKKKDWQGKNIDTSFEENAEMLRDFCCNMKALGKQVVLVAPSPLFPNLNKELCGTAKEYIKWMNHRNKSFDDKDDKHPLVMTKTFYDNYYKDVINLFATWEEQGFCSVLHVEKVLFKDERFIGLQGDVMRCRDATHITPPASIEIMRSLADEFTGIISRNRGNKK